MTLKTFHHINRLAHEITETERVDAMRQLDNQAKRQKEFAGALQQATADYVLTGIGKIPDAANCWVGWVRWGDRRRFQWDCYFAELARDLKRPFVYVEPQWGTLIIQRRKYTEPLIGMFMLTAAEEGPHCGRRTPNTVSYRRTSDRWYFYFTGITTKLLEAWLDECRTNPEFRRALKLT